jgi:hypothetical protein
MNPIDLTVVYLDGTEETVSAVAADLIAFESHFDLSIARLDKELRLTHLVFMAWHVLKRTKKTTETFEVFTERVAGVAQAEGKG